MVPYNIWSGGWWTGLSFTSWYGGGTLYIGIGDTAGNFRDIEIRNSAGNGPDWTGLVQYLFPSGASFQEPVNVLVMSERPFTVTQFIGNPYGGFGIHVFESKSVNDYPY